MTSTKTNSASALNDDIWANHFADFLPEGLRFFINRLDGSSPTFGTHPAPGAPVYTTMPMPGGGVGTSATPALVPSDNDLYGLQWHFDFLGDIQKLWGEYSGAGVHVGVYDDGLQYTHPDLAANYDASLQVIVEGQVVDALPSTLIGHPHGTAVAGLIAAANNGFGTVGVAWGASLTGVNIFSGSADINSNYSGFLEAVSQMGNFDITNHSWGKFPGFWQDGVTIAMDQSLIDRWFDALETGRGGLGTINVKAAGNADQNSNGDGSGITRATITVGAYDDDGDASYYSSYGSNLLVSAPSSGLTDFFAGAINQGLVTTDITPVMDAGGLLPLGYNGLPDWDYTNKFGGTSGATPIVSGVVALMLSANENLGWRDVQNILAYSAHEVGSGVGGVHLNDENNVWKYNGADNWNGGGLHYSEDYGYGGIDAYNAVRMAEVWNLFGSSKTSANESSFKQTTTESVALLDGKQTNIYFQFHGADFTVDFVDIAIDLTHAKLDDLEISLVSPDGTVTSLIDFRFELSYQEGLQQATLSFGGNAFRGENGAGEWTLRVVDRWVEDEGTVNSASITLHGTDTADGTHNTASDVYHYTDEVFKTIARDGTRIVLSDTDGGTDWLNMAAMTGDLIVRMQQGWSSNVGGVAFLRIASGTEIENLVTGDGNDRITGSFGNNVIYGMRGDDVINGANGDDTISGGAGNDILEGSTGSDIFLFDRALDAATNVDTIVDFNYYEASFFGIDKIWLDSSIFVGLALGNLSSDAFTLGTAAEDALDRLIYDAATGALYFDADGSGAAAQIKFAQFDYFSTINNGPHATLSFSDFEVVDTSHTVVTGSGTDRVQPDAPTTSTSTDTPNLFGIGTPINGTQYDDEIIAKSGNEIINGLAGNDLLAGGGGDDTINGGAGYDRIFGEDGDDILRGDDTPTSTTSGFGDEIYGGAGNDVIHGSSQTNFFYNVNTSFDAPGDRLEGEGGDDVIYGYDGNDRLAGGDGNDRLYGGDGSDYFHGGSGDDYMEGGAGSDIFNGGFGDDTFIVGKGIENLVYGGDLIDRSAPERNVIGIDTVIFEGNFADYKVTGGVHFYFGNDGGLLFSNQTVGTELADQDNTTIEWQTIERLVFNDQVIDLVARPMALTVGDLLVLNDYVNAGTPVTVTANGWESSVSVLGAGDVTITDIADVHELDFVRLLEVNGTTTITSDVIQAIDIANIDGSLTINAAAGERSLAVRSYGLRLDANEKLSDNTATSVDLLFRTNSVLGGESATPSIATAGVNGANLSFQTARTINIRSNDETVDVRWDVRNATTIDMNPAFQIVHEVTGDFMSIFETGNIATFNILTPLDDSILATAGSTAEFQYIGMELQGRDIVRFGNLGDVNLSNDGTVGDDALTNAGLGLRGTIKLGGDKDEARILGSGAFQGGTIDGGFVDPEYGFLEADVIRMTFGVAEAIGNISDYISNFEILQLDATAQSHTVDVSHFDNMQQIDVTSSVDNTGDSTITNVVENSTVTFRTAGGRDDYNNNLGTVTLDVAGDGPNDTINLVFVGALADGLDVGKIIVTDAETVSIRTDSLENNTGLVDDLGLPLPLGQDTDPFAQIQLVLSEATTVTLTGETGWDFTIPGTIISKVTRIDASGITGAGAISGVTAASQTDDAVTFIGGAGDDVFTGGAGADNLSGGSGNDTYILNAGSIGDTITELANDGVDTIRTSLSSIDLNDYQNIENGELTGSANISITGNAGRNALKGNAGNNTLDGGAGADTAVFTGNRTDYRVEANGNGSFTVTDLRAAPQDGTDTLINVEYLQFADGRHSVNPTAPTDIQLSNNTVLEASYENILVGVVSATDAEGDTAIFELVDDSGGRFKLVNGNEIRTVDHAKLDYEQRSTYDIQVKVTDGDGLSLVKTLTINLIDTNPDYQVARGDIDTDDILWGGAHNDFLAGNGGNDVLRGQGGNDSLRGGAGIDTAEYSGNRSDYQITYANRVVTVRDLRSNADGTGYDGIDSLSHYGGIREGVSWAEAIEFLKFADQTVALADVIAPTGMALSAAAVSEAATGGTVVGTLTTTDLSDVLPGTVTETFTYTLLDDAGGLFELDGDRIVVAEGAVLDYETATSHSIRVRVTDSDGHTFERTFAISVTDSGDENGAPTDILPDTASIAENAADGTEVATLSAVDPDTGETFTYTLADSAGGRFAIVNGKLVVADSTGLDYEAATEHTVTVRVTDSAGNTLEQDITINVTDVAENAAPTVSLANMRASLAETTQTTGRIKVADIILADDGIGTNRLSLIGRDRAMFEIVGMALFLKAGAALDGSKLASLEVAVAVDDDDLPGSPDATSATYKLAIIDNPSIKMIHGTSKSETLSGTTGNDYFDGHGGSDTFKGGKGNDIYVVDSAGDKVIEAAKQGTDKVYSSIDYTLGANLEILTLLGSGDIDGYGNSANNTITGNAGNNLLRGGAGNDKLVGGAGNDTLVGDAGNDTLIGGLGRDVLRGGTGKDMFVFNDVAESTVGSVRDVITDFARGQDKIDLSAIDAKVATSANDAFAWFGTKAFTGSAGQLRFNDLGAEVIVQGDVDGNGVADFEIHIKVATIAASDFIL